MKGAATNGVERVSRIVNIAQGVVAIAAFLLGGLAFYLSSQIGHLAEQVTANQTASDKTADLAMAVQIGAQSRASEIEKDVAYLRGRQDMFHELYVAGKIVEPKP